MKGIVRASFSLIGSFRYDSTVRAREGSSTAEADERWATAIRQLFILLQSSTIYGYSDWSLTEQTNDEVSMGKIAGAFVFLIKKHGEERREERRGNLAKLLQSEICGTETLKTRSEEHTSE